MRPQHGPRFGTTSGNWVAPHYETRHPASPKCGRPVQADCQKIENDTDADTDNDTILILIRILIMIMIH